MRSLPVGDVMNDCNYINRNADVVFQMLYLRILTQKLGTLAAGYVMLFQYQ